MEIEGLPGSWITAKLIETETGLTYKNTTWYRIEITLKAFGETGIIYRTIEVKNDAK